MRIERHVPLHAHDGGFDLHAAVHVAAGDRERLERLCQYLCRPPLGQGRLHRLNDGRVAVALQRPWADGTEARSLPRPPRIAPPGSWRIGRRSRSPPRLGARRLHNAPCLEACELRGKDGWPVPSFLRRVAVLTVAPPRAYEAYGRSW